MTKSEVGPVEVKVDFSLTVRNRLGFVRLAFSPARFGRLRLPCSTVYYEEAKTP